MRCVIVGNIRTTANDRLNKVTICEWRRVYNIIFVCVVMKHKLFDTGTSILFSGLLLMYMNMNMYMNCSMVTNKNIWFASISTVSLSQVHTAPIHIYIFRIVIDDRLVLSFLQIVFILWSSLRPSFANESHDNNNNNNNAYIIIIHVARRCVVLYLRRNLL